MVRDQLKHRVAVIMSFVTTNHYCTTPLVRLMFRNSGEGHLDAANNSQKPFCSISRRNIRYEKLLDSRLFIIFTQLYCKY